MSPPPPPRTFPRIPVATESVPSVSTVPTSSLSTRHPARHPSPSPPPPPPPPSPPKTLHPPPTSVSTLDLVLRTQGSQWVHRCSRGHQSGWVCEADYAVTAAAAALPYVVQQRTRVPTGHRAPGPRSRHRMFQGTKAATFVVEASIRMCGIASNQYLGKHGCKRRRSVVLSSIGGSHAYVWGLSIAEQILVLFRN